MNKDGMTLIKNKPKMFDYFNLNDSKDLQESFNKNENGNKSNFNGYNKKDKNNHKKEISYYKKIWNILQNIFFPLIKKIILLKLYIKINIMIK